MSTHAERYAAAAQRRRDVDSGLRAFADSLPYELDGFQHAACRCVAGGDSVLVAAPTGSGKTVVGEFAAFLALQRSQRLFYTTPIKALSNQKFRDFQNRFGEENVGLLTGDRSVNGDAPLVVMTTEVLRNMLYSADGIGASVAFVVMDEVHYLADRTRGAVWEEVIIHLPQMIQVVALSATVSNAEEFGAWLQSVRGRVAVIVEEHRPVPLSQQVAVDGELVPLFQVPGQVSQGLVARLRRAQAEQWQPGRRGRAPRGGHRQSRGELVELLEGNGLLPAIHFIFSRSGCEAALAQCRAAGLRLTTPQERLAIRGIVDQMCEPLPDADLAVLGWGPWRDSLECGLAAHHAGLIPLFKEVVERLFQEGLLKVVFATETLALGINMPARSVVIERLSKWNGEQHAALSAGEYTQLTGRAGRRGLDTEGTAVVPWSADLDVQSLAGLASTRTYPLNSSFRPTYNMTVNLVSRFGAEAAVEILERSFAQFQVEQRLAGLSHALRTAQTQAEEMSGFIECHLGDFDEYFQLRARLASAERALAQRTTTTQRLHIGRALDGLHRGDVVLVDHGRNSGFAVVVEVGKQSEDAAARPLVLGVDRRVRRVSVHDFAAAPDIVAHVRFPAGFSLRRPDARKQLASALREATRELSSARRPARPAASDSDVTALRAQLRAHPCHGCSDREEHARFAHLRERAIREGSTIEQRIGQRTGTLGKQFERTCLVLADLGYLTRGATLLTTPAGHVLSGIYADLDLLTAEAVHTGVFDRLPADQLAAVGAFIVYEARGDDVALGEPVTSPLLRDSMVEVHAIWQRVNEVEERFRVRTQRPLDPGFVRPALAWARGANLATALTQAQMQPGDFVRWCRQVIDWLLQLKAVVPADHPLRTSAAAAIRAIDRDLVQLQSW